MLNKVFDNETYEQQRINIELLAKKYPDDWFYKSQMALPSSNENGVCTNQWNMPTLWQRYYKRR